MKRNVILGLGAAALTTLALASCGGSKDELQVVQVLATIEGTDTAGNGWDPVTAAQGVAQELGTKDKAIDIILSNNDGMALGILKDGTYANHKEVPVFGVDALADAIQSIKDGKLAGTIKNDSYSQAKVAVQAALNLINNKAITDGMTAETMPGIYTDAAGKVALEEGTKALRVHHQMITKANVNKLETPELVDANVIGKVGSENKFFALTYNNADPNMSGLWKPGFNDFGKALDAEITWADAANKDEQAIQLLEQNKNGDFDAFLINPVDNTNVKKYIDTLKDTGKPIIIWNREGSKEHMAGYDKVYYVGIESAEGGRLQGKMAGEYILANGGLKKFDRNGDGKIGALVIRGEKGHPDAEARTANAPKYLDEVLAAKK